MPITDFFRCCTAIAFLLALTPDAVATEAEIHQPSTSSNADADADAGVILDTGVDRLQRYVTSRVQASALWADGFFGDETFVDETAHSRLSLREQVAISALDHAYNKFKVSIRVELPKMSKKMSLIIEGNDEETRDDDDLDFGDILNDSTRSSSIGLQHFSYKSDHLNISMSAGVRSSPAFYAGPRIRFQHGIESGWTGRYIQNLRWFSDTGWFSDTRADFDRKPSSESLFRQSARIKWREDRRKTEGVGVSLASSYTRRLRDDAALRYSWTNQYFTKPTSGFTESALSVNYRRQFLRKWFYVELSPYIAFQKVHEWRFNPGVSMQLELIFSDQQNKTSPLDAR